jgi:hypothetical protein
MSQHICNRECRRRGCVLSKADGRYVPAPAVAPVQSEEPTINTFYFDQDDATDTPCCVLTRAQARGMRREGRGKYENNGKTFRLFDRSPRSQRTFQVSESPGSKPTISTAEMKANVGITEDEPDRPANRAVVKRAQQKIRAIGRRELGTYDDRSPLAFGSYAVGS